ncbi:MAG: diguanylate cyclase [Zoogloeaceae bacterium]|nr:diguanylate cyclase [Zoogloeaceae bacterium]
MIFAAATDVIERNADLSALIEVLPQAVFVKDGAGYWRQLNRAALTLFGLADTGWQGKTDRELARELPHFAATLEACHGYDEAAWTKGSRFESEEAITNPATGETYLFAVSRNPIFHADGSRHSIVVLATDITAARAAEAAEKRQKDSLRRLSEVAAHIRLPLDQQFREALAAGCAQYGLEFGIVSRIEGECYTVLSHISPPGTLSNGQTFPLGITYCSMVLAENDIVAIPRMHDSPRRGHPCYQAFQLEAYIGAPIIVNEAIYGTVNFSSAKDYERSFDEGDHEFIALLSRWVGAAIEREQMTQSLASSELKWRTIVDNKPDCVKLLARDGTLLQMNRAGLALLGAESAEQVVGQSVLPFISPEFREAFAALNDSVFSGASGTLEFSLTNLAGKTLWLETRATPLRTPSGEITAQLAITRDISPRKANEAAIYQLAFYDALTELPNRRLLIDRLNQALAQCRREAKPLAILYIDLDHFKEINDTRGHEIGDRLLCEVSARLQDSIRASDTVARQGGDEFIVLAETALPRDAEIIAGKIITALLSPIVIDGHELCISPSIGIAVLPEKGTDDAMELLKKADIAMYAAKSAGRNTYRFYTE